MISCVDTTAEVFPEFKEAQHYKEIMQQLYAQMMGWC